MNNWANTLSLWGLTIGRLAFWGYKGAGLAGYWVSEYNRVLAEVI